MENKIQKKIHDDDLKWGSTREPKETLKGIIIKEESKQERKEKMIVIINSENKWNKFIRKIFKDKYIHRIRGIDKCKTKNDLTGKR
jgi:hypothetical protein